MKVLLRKVLGLGLFVTEFLMKRIENYIEDFRRLKMKGPLIALKVPQLLFPTVVVIVKTPDCGAAAARDWITTSINTLSTFQLRRRGKHKNILLAWL